MKKVILFDFDGTVANTFPLVRKILQDFSTKYGYKKFTDKESLAMRDYSIKEVFHHMHVSFYKLPFMAADIKKELNKSVNEIEPIKGVTDILSTLKKTNYTLGLVTSNNKNNVQAFLQKHKLELFDIIHTGTSAFGKAKVIQDLLNKYTIAKDQVIYIGDEIRDIEATKKVGIPIIAATWGYNSRKGLERYQPKFLIDNPHEILALV